MALCVYTNKQSGPSAQRPNSATRPGRLQICPIKGDASHMGLRRINMLDMKETCASFHTCFRTSVEGSVHRMRLSQPLVSEIALFTPMTALEPKDAVTVLWVRRCSRMPVAFSHKLIPLCFTSLWELD